MSSRAIAQLIMWHSLVMVIFKSVRGGGGGGLVNGALVNRPTGRFPTGQQGYVFSQLVENINSSTGMFKSKLVDRPTGRQLLIYYIIGRLVESINWSNMSYLNLVLDWL